MPRKTAGIVPVLKDEFLVHINISLSGFSFKLIDFFSDFFKSTGTEEDNLDGHQEGEKESLEKPFGLGKELLQRILKYILDKKRYPTNFPENHCRAEFNFPPPKHVVPSEKFCSECGYNLPLSEPILITSKAKIVTLTCVYEGKCSNKILQHVAIFIFMYIII